MTHDVFRHHDAAYVLGALTPGDRQAYEDHMRACEECRCAVTEVAGLPGLLARVGPEVLEQGQEEAVVPPLPDTLLPGLLAEVRRSRRRRRAWSGAVAAAGVTAIVAAGVAIGLPDRADDPTGGTQVTAGQVMTPVDDAHLRARLAMEDVAWGTRLSITCTYGEVTYGTAQPAYVLVVSTSKGEEQVATWHAVPGRETTVTAATASPSSEITSVEVRTTRGEPVLRLTG